MVSGAREPFILDTPRAQSGSHCLRIGVGRCEPGLRDAKELSQRTGHSRALTFSTCWCTGVHIYQTGGRARKARQEAAPSGTRRAASARGQKEKDVQEVYSAAH